MKVNLRSLYPHEWQKHFVKEDDREFLVRHFEPGNLEDATRVVDLVAKIAVEHKLQDQVQFSVDARRLMIFIHYSDAGPIEESHNHLASAINAELRPS